MSGEASYWQPIAGGTYLGVVPSKRFPIYTRGNAGEVFPEVQYPLSFTSSWDLSVESFRDSAAMAGVLTAEELDDPTAMVACFGGYAYLNMSSMRTTVSRIPGSNLEDVDRQYMGSSEAPAFVAEKGDKSLRGAMAGIRYALSVLRMKETRQQDVDATAVDSWRKNLPDRTVASDEELLELFRSSQAFVGKLFRNHLFVSAQTTVPVGLLSAFCEKRCKDPSLVPRLLGGAGNVASAAPSDALWRLGRQVADNSALGAMFDAGSSDLYVRITEASGRSDADGGAKQFAKDFAKFLDEFGCRGPNEWETACPTWGTNPELALALVDRMRFADATHAPSTRNIALVADREAAFKQANRRLGPLGRRRLRKIVQSATMFCQARELAKTTVVRAIHEFRLTGRELAARCAARSHGQWNDMWFVTAGELDAYVADPSAFADKIAERRAMRDLLATREPPFIVNGDIPPFETWERRDAELVTGVSVGEVLSGIAGCAGVARGIARIVLDPSTPRELGPGDVLVAPYTDPAWTPLFVPVEAVIVDVGAMLSHAVIVSRELGIPSVVSITGATKRIPDGALVEVDGHNGTVTILELPAQ